VNQTYLLNLEDIILKKLEQVRPLYSLSLSLSHLFDSRFTQSCVIQL